MTCISTVTLLKSLQKCRRKRTNSLLPMQVRFILASIIYIHLHLSPLLLGKMLRNAEVSCIEYCDETHEDEENPPTDEEAREQLILKSVIIYHDKDVWHFFFFFFVNIFLMLVKLVGRSTPRCHHIPSRLDPLVQ